MRAITAPNDIYRACRELQSKHCNIGLVPTMGALHEGHLKLAELSMRNNDVTVVSIFVNPLQFNNQEDLKKYPQTLYEDLEKLTSLGVDFVFHPIADELYPSKPTSSISFGEMEKMMEGKHRPGHFAGVGIVVSKLINLTCPTRAYFGLKDLQQFLLVKRMVEDLSIQVEIVGVETVRESSGLAMSSRNLRMTDEGRVVASQIYKGLELAKEGFDLKQPIKTLMADVNAFYSSVQGLETEYLEVVDASSLLPTNNYDGINELAICFAGYVEGVRLIDNLYLQLK